jgi:hypothetical protein
METITESDSVPQKAEYGDKYRVFDVFHIPESSLYFLDKAGKIRSAIFSVRTGRGRGKRLYDLNSIREFLAIQIEQPGKNQEEAPAAVAGAAAQSPVPSKRKRGSIPKAAANAARLKEKEVTA